MFKNSNLIGKENRLVHYIKPTDKTRYTTRVAEANADAQARTYQEAVSRNQQTAATEQAAAGNLSGAAYYSNSAESLKPAPVTMMDQNGPTSASVLDQARQSSQGAITYNNQTGQTSPQLQFGDRINDAMKGTTLSLTDVEETVRKQYADMGISDPAIINNGIASAIQADNARNQAADITSQRDARRADMGARNSAASNKAGSKATPAPVKPSKVDSVANMLDGVIAASGDPMGPVYKEMILQDLADMEDAQMGADASLEGSLNRADDQYSDTMSFIDKYIDLHSKNNDKLTTILDQTRDDQQKYLAEQEQRDMDRLAWEGDREEERMAKQKTAQLLSKSIQNALGGGAFSGAASEQLASTEREWDNAISSLAAEYSFKKADVSAFYKQKYIDTNNQFNLDIFNASKALDEKIEGYSIQGFNSLQARENAKTQAYNDHSKTIADAKKTYSSSLKGYVKEIQTTMKEERAYKAKTQDDLWGRLFTQRAQDGNLNPTLTQKILDQMKAAGIDVSGVDPNAMTESQVNELHRQAEFARKEQADRGGRPMTQGQVTEIAGLNDALSLLEDVENSLLNEFENVGGPISGRLGSIPGAELLPLVGDSAMRVKEFNSKVALVKQIIGKALEGGVLRKEDEEKYKHILPNINDTDRIRATKMENLRHTIENKRNGYIRDASLGGYDTSGYDIGDPLQNNEIPTLTDDEVIDILDKLDRGEDVTFSSDNAGGALAALGTKETQGFTTPIGTNLYSPQTVKAWGGQHKGIDIAMPSGTPLPATVSGEVIAAGYENGWGNTVLIRGDDGSEHRFSHLDRFDVKRGDKVKPGQMLALSGGAKGAKGAGTSTGPHLDYRIKVKGQYIDPYTYKISSTS